jgi:hypothetical protein
MMHGTWVKVMDKSQDCQQGLWSFNTKNDPWHMGEIEYKNASKTRENVTEEIIH